MGNSFHMWITVRKNRRNVFHFIQNSAKKLRKNTIIYIKQQRSKSHIFGFFASATSFPPWYKTTLPHNVYYVDTRVWYKWLLVSRGGGGDVPYNNSVFGCLYSKNSHIFPKISKIIPNSEIFCQILMIHYQAIKKTNIFCINQKVYFGADLEAFFLS